MHVSSSMMRSGSTETTHDENWPGTMARALGTVFAKEGVDKYLIRQQPMPAILCIASTLSGLF